MNVAEAAWAIRWKLACKSRLVRALLHADYPAYERREQGQWLSLLTNDADSYFDQIRELAGYIVMLPAGIVMLALSLRVNVPLTLVALGVGLLLFGAREGLNRSLAKRLKRWQDERAGNTEKILDVFRGMSSARWQSAQGVLLSAFQKANGRLRKSELARDDLLGMIQCVDQALVYLKDALFFLVAIGQIAEGDIALGGILSVYAVQQTFSTPFAFLAPLRTSLKQIRVFGRRLEDALAVRPEQDGAGDSGKRLERPTLEMEDVSFAYGAGGGLGPLSARIPFGTRAMVRGKSGAGKTTLFKLLTRLYEPAAGTIRISGADYRDTRREKIRETIACVPQDFTIFTDTIGNNIALGQADASREDIAEAADKAHIRDFIEALPEGYDTMLNDMGHNLSAGQRQRIAIARAILRKAPILLLDEVSAKLDPRIAEELLEAIYREYEGRTVLSISHQGEREARGDMEISL